MPPVPAVPPTLPAPAPAQVQVQASLVRIRVPQRGGRVVRMGSGVVVAPGVVATNAHVMGEADPVQPVVVVKDQATVRVVRSQVDGALDLCLLYVPGLPAPPAAFRPDPPQPGEPVYAGGYPGGIGPVVTAGRLRAVWHVRSGLLLQVDTEIHPGSSGSGLFDGQGRLVGLMTFVEGGITRLSFALGLESIRSLLDRPGPGSLDSGSILSPEDLLSDAAGDPRNWPAWEPAARQWVELEPERADAWFALGLAQDRLALEQGRLDLASEAARAYRRALALRPDPRTWNNLGAALDAQNRFEEAEHAFGEALRLRPAYGLAWLNLGSTRLNAGRYREAAEAFRRGLDLEPAAVDGWVRLGLCCRKLEDGAGEVAALRVALGYRPMDRELWLTLGLALGRSGRIEEARDILRQLETRGWEAQARRLAAELKAAPRRR